jgi:hypothetical protein
MDHETEANMLVDAILGESLHSPATTAEKKPIELIGQFTDRFEPFSLLWLNQLLLFFNQTVTKDLCKQLIQKFTSITALKARPLAAYFVGLHKSRTGSVDRVFPNKYTKDAFMSQFPSVNTKACEHCHQLHPTKSPHSHPPAKYSKNSRAKIATTTQKLSTTRAVRAKRGSKSVIPAFNQDSDYSVDSSDSDPEVTCTPCILSNASKKNPIKAMQALSCPCLRTDLHEDLFHCIENDFEAEVVRLSEIISTQWFDLIGTLSVQKVGEGALQPKQELKTPSRTSSSTSLSFRPNSSSSTSVPTKTTSHHERPPLYNVRANFHCFSSHIALKTDKDV